MPVSHRSSTVPGACNTEETGIELQLMARGSSSEVSVSPRDRILGCIVGGAIGDALGASFEGQSAASAAEIWSGPPRRLTDDTQLTLATCEAIASAGVAEPAALAASFLRWFRAGRLTGLGASTLKALRDLDAGAHWALAGRRGERAAGNGAAMRIAPLAFCTDPQTEQGRRLIRDICRITHHSDEAYVGALAVVLAIRTSLHPEEADFHVREIAEQLPDTSVRDRMREYGGLPPTFHLAEAATRFGTSGYVVESVPFALFAAQQVNELGFVEMMEQVVLAGGDTDTNGSLTGQVVGSRLGLAGLPTDLVAGLPQAELVMRIAGTFADALTRGAL
jgi:ADP-ribosyl-[dinitrogen reductase] hydrolase